MTSHNENPPPSYNEATSDPSSSTTTPPHPADESRPEGWVEGYVERPRAEHYQPPAPVDEKVDAAASAQEAQPASAKPPPPPSSSRLSFGGLDFGSKVLGYGYGNEVYGAGIKIGPLLLGVVDVDKEKAEREERKNK